MIVAALGYALIASAIGWAAVFALGDELIGKDDRVRLCAFWFILTVILFTMPSGLLFLLVLALALGIMGARDDVDPIALGLFALFCVPAAGLAIRDLPGINFLLNFTAALIVSMVIFMPSVVRGGGARAAPGQAVGAPAKPGKRELRIIDLAVFAMFVLLIALEARGANFTSALRNATEWTFRLLFPYLAFSRAITTPERLDRVLRTFVTAIVVAGVVAFAISIIHWQFYDVPEGRLFDWRPPRLRYRLGLMRSGGPMGGAPISFGTISMIGVAVAIGLAATMKTRWKRWLVIAVPVIAVFASVSRGPMVGTVLMAIAYQATKPNPVGALVKNGLIASVFALPVLLFTGFGRDLLSLIPGLSEETVGAGSVDYREDLFEIGMRVARKNPLFGRPDYKSDPEMQALVQGEQIIDIVNTYLSYALEYGFVTMSVYVFVIASCAASLFVTLRRLPANDPSGLREIGGALFAALSAFAAVVFTTTSTTGLLPTFTWIFFGLCVAYVRVVRAMDAVPAAQAARARPHAPTAPADVPDALPAFREAPEAADEAPRPAPARSSIGAQTGDFEFVWPPRPAPDRS